MTETLEYWRERTATAEGQVVDLQRRVTNMERDAAIRTKMLDNSDALIEQQKQELTTLRANVDPKDMLKKLGAAYQALQEYTVVLGDRGPNA